MESTKTSARRGAARTVALITALLMGVLGLSVPTAAQAAGPSGPYTVSGKVSFAPGSPAAPLAQLLRAVNSKEADATRSGLYLSLGITMPDYSVKEWSYGDDANVTVNTSTGDWSVKNVANGTYRLFIGVTLPKGGYVSVASNVQVKVAGADVVGFNYTANRDARLTPVLQSCRKEALAPTKVIAKNTTTNVEYPVTPGQRGWDNPTPTAKCPSGTSNGIMDLLGAPAGDYIIYYEQSGIREYYAGSQIGTLDRSQAKTLTLKSWEGNQTSFVYGSAKPIDAAAPKISGTVKTGSTLKASAGKWTSGAAFKYQWQRNGVSISKATKSSYKLSSSDVKKKITVKVTGTKKGYWPAAKTSSAILKSATPKARGTKKVGKTLKVSLGSWATGTKFSYRWYRNGKAITGATKSSYKLKSADAGKRIKVKVTGKKSGYATKSRTSSSTPKIRR